MNEVYPNAFEAYGALVAANVSPTEQAGRYPSQQDAERLIVEDVNRKLGLQPQHSLLEIGCGPGNLLIPLSFGVKSAVGIDHASIIKYAQCRFSDQSVTWIAGQFPDVEIGRSFDRILCYSVINYQPDMTRVIAFVESAVELLNPRGKMLLGDIPNRDRKRRFTESDYGRAFEREWQQSNAASRQACPLHFDSALSFLSDDDVIGIIRHFRKLGFHVDLLPQSPSLPFGNTREDILIARP